MEAIAKFDFKATADDDLSFKKGDCLRILKTSGNWYKAEHDKIIGFVPKNYLAIDLPSWYQENTSRSEAQERLMSQPVGAFLIRSSQSAAPGDFSISVRHPADVQHFKVLRNSRGQYYLWSEKFPSLNQLVDYYKSNSISKHSPVFLRETQKQQHGGHSDKLRAPLPIAPASDYVLSPTSHEPPGGFSDGRPVRLPVPPAFDHSRSPTSREHPGGFSDGRPVRLPFPPASGHVLSPASHEPGGFSDRRPVHLPVVPASGHEPSSLPREPGGFSDRRPVHLPVVPASGHEPSSLPREHKASATLQVRALYDFRAEEMDELDFNAGDIIRVVEVSDQAWWRGQLRGKIGLFPSNYTKPI